MELNSCRSKSQIVRIKANNVKTLKELSKATNNFDERHIVGSGNTDAPIYKGSHEGRTLTIWRITNSSEPTIACVFNEIVMLSQINHRNVLRILGGCFETATPMPVFEFICNESLYHVIHEKDLSSRISWENHLRIATEVADALAYLHTGTAGSVDPYYHSTGQVTEKCDVYSYGVLLLKLLTGRKTFEWSETWEGAGFVLVDFAISSMKGNQLHLIFEPCKLKERNREQLMACAELAMKCIIKWKPDERPTMKEAAQELRQIKDIL